MSAVEAPQKRRMKASEIPEADLQPIIAHWRARQELEDEHAIHEIARDFNTITTVVHSLLELTLGAEYRLQRVLMKLSRWGGDAPQSTVWRDLKYTDAEIAEVLALGWQTGVLRTYDKVTPRAQGGKVSVAMLAVSCPPEAPVQIEEPARRKRPAASTTFGKSPLASARANHVRHHVKGGKPCNCPPEITQEETVSRHTPPGNHTERQERWRLATAEFRTRWQRAGYGEVNALVKNLAAELSIPDHEVRDAVRDIISQHREEEALRAAAGTRDPMIAHANAQIERATTDRVVDRVAGAVADVQVARREESLAAQRAEVEQAHRTRNERRQAQVGSPDAQTMPSTNGVVKPITEAKLLDDAVSEIKAWYDQQFVTSNVILGDDVPGSTVFDADVTCLRPVQVWVPCRFTVMVRAQDAFGTQDVLRKIDGYQKAHSVVEK